MDIVVHINLNCWWEKNWTILQHHVTGAVAGIMCCSKTLWDVVAVFRAVVLVCRISLSSQPVALSFIQCQDIKCEPDDWCGIIPSASLSSGFAALPQELKVDLPILCWILGIHEGCFHVFSYGEKHQVTLVTQQIRLLHGKKFGRVMGYPWLAAK